jgi:hypothetical protein
MATVDVAVAAGADDGEVNVTTSELISNSDWAHVGYWGGAYTQRMWVRFTGVNLAGTVNASYLTIYSRWGGAEDITITLRAERNAAPAAPTTWADYAARPRTTANVVWAVGTTAWATDQPYNSPSLNTVLQDLATAHGPLVNSSLLLFLDGDGSGADRYIHTYESNPSYVMRLHIDYSAASGSLVPPNLARRMAHLLVR